MDLRRSSARPLNQRRSPWQKRCQIFSQLALEAAEKNHVGVRGILATPAGTILATPARYCVAVPWYCDAVPKRQDELGAIIGPKKHQRGVLCPIEGCWGPILPFGSCRLGHF